MCGSVCKGVGWRVTVWRCEVCGCGGVRVYVWRGKIWNEV